MLPWRRNVGFGVAFRVQSGLIFDVGKEALIDARLEVANIGRRPPRPSAKSEIQPLTSFPLCLETLKTSSSASE